MIQAWPKPINYWTFGTGEMIVANDKFVVEENELNGYKFQLVLVIKKLEKVQKLNHGFADRSKQIKTRTMSRATLAPTDV